MKEEEIEKGDCGPPTRSKKLQNFFWLAAMLVIAKVSNLSDDCPVLFLLLFLSSPSHRF